MLNYDPYTEYNDENHDNEKRYISYNEINDEDVKRKAIETLKDTATTVVKYAGAEFEKLAQKGLIISVTTEVQTEGNKFKLIITVEPTELTYDLYYLWLEIAERERYIREMTMKARGISAKRKNEKN